MTVSCSAYGEQRKQWRARSRSRPARARRACREKTSRCNRCPTVRIRISISERATSARGKDDRGDKFMPCRLPRPKAPASRAARNAAGTSCTRQIAAPRAVAHIWANSFVISKGSEPPINFKKDFRESPTRIGRRSALKSFKIAQERQIMRQRLAETEARIADDRFQREAVFLRAREEFAEEIDDLRRRRRRSAAPPASSPGWSSACIRT